ncbi:hypothetical protein EDD22DRAFT_942532 [Suillus occidentalis]|nr:hypothetical protein EDD22DRAFT_942532 [Suillus occidentalis]
MRKLGRLHKLRQWSFVRRRTPIYPLSYERGLLLNSIFDIRGAIAKALELFLAMIVEEATKVTAERGAKKVEAYHLKHAIETTEMLDFLKEIVESVPDPSAGGTIDLQAEAAENAKRKRSKAKKNGATTGEGPKRRRKKKEDVDTEGVPEETMVEAKSEEGDPRMEDD